MILEIVVIKYIFQIILLFCSSKNYSIFSATTTTLSPELNIYVNVNCPIDKIQLWIIYFLS